MTIEIPQSARSQKVMSHIKSLQRASRRAGPERKRKIQGQIVILKEEWIKCRDESRAAWLKKHNKLEKSANPSMSAIGNGKQLSLPFALQPRWRNYSR